MKTYTITDPSGKVHTIDGPEGATREQFIAKIQERLSSTQQQPQVDPRVVSYADQWIKANPWYDVNGRDEDSRITKAIDDGLVREGYNPADQDYWLELTKRVAARIGDDTDDPPRRTQQPTGNSREHVPSSTRKQVYVTAERKAAMIEAGVWDDPSKRAKFLKAYQDYDRNSASR